MKSRMTIGTKLTISYSAMLALMLVMGTTDLRSIDQVNSELVTATQKTARRLQLAGIMDKAGSDMLAGQRGIVMFTYAKDPARVQAAKTLFHSAADRWQAAIDEVLPLMVREDG